MLAAQALGQIRRVHIFEVLEPQELHPHRRHLTKFERRIAVQSNRFIAIRQRVKGVPAFMQKSLHVVVRTCGVGENFSCNGSGF